MVALAACMLVICVSQGCVFLVDTAIPILLRFPIHQLSTISGLILGFNKCQNFVKVTDNIGNVVTNNMYILFNYLSCVQARAC